MKPTIGRIVHYTIIGDHDVKAHAAIITKVNTDTDTVALHVFSPTGVFDIPDVKKTSAVAGSDDARGMWNWPARE